MLVWCSCGIAPQKFDQTQGQAKVRALSLSHLGARKGFPFRQFGRAMQIDAQLTGCPAMKADGQWEEKAAVRRPFTVKNYDASAMSGRAFAP